MQIPQKWEIWEKFDHNLCKNVSSAIATRKYLGQFLKENCERDWENKIQIWTENDHSFK